MPVSRYLYVAQGLGMDVRQVDISKGASGLVTVVASFPSNVVGIVISSNDENLFITCPFLHSIYRINILSGAKSLLAGAGLSTGQLRVISQLLIVTRIPF